MTKYTYVIPRWEKYNPNFYYLTDKDIDHSILIYSENEKMIITNQMNYDLCYNELGKKFDIKIMNNIELKKYLGKQKTKYLIDGSINVNLYMQLRNKNMKIGYSEFKKMREIKSSSEIDKMKKAVKITKDMIEKINVIGKNESEIRKEILTQTFNLNLEKAFEPIVANSTNARFPHYNEYKSIITDYCLIDYGIEFDKYKSDITRCIGNLKNNNQNYEKLQNCVNEIAETSYAGMSVKEFVINSENVVRKQGLDKFKHSIGHGIGLEVHEYPILNEKNSDMLKENSVITLEPGQYNSTGLRYENVYVVGKKKLKEL